MGGEMSGDHNQYQKDRSYLDDRRGDIIRMAQDSGVLAGYEGEPSFLERFADLVAAAERNKLAAWMRDYGYATGHGDTMEQLCDALGTEIVDSIEAEVEAEREACAKLLEDASGTGKIISCTQAAKAIRARGQA
jgi:hypothetical protein